MYKAETLLACFAAFAAVAQANATCQEVAVGDFCTASFECQSSCCDLSTLTCSADTLLDQCSVDAACPASAVRELQSDAVAAEAGS